jgi:dienelactone hydrolase
MTIAARNGLFSYHDGSHELEGYLAMPAGASAAPKRPVVLVVHAWGGQDEFARAKAHMIADLGYIGFAIDVYGKGRRGASPGLNRSLRSVVPFCRTGRSGLARARSGRAVCALLSAA